MVYCHKTRYSERWYRCYSETVYPFFGLKSIKSCSRILCTKYILVEHTRSAFQVYFLPLSASRFRCCLCLAIDSLWPDVMWSVVTHWNGLDCFTFPASNVFISLREVAVSIAFAPF